MMAKKDITITKIQKEKLEKDISELSLPYFYSTREFTFGYLTSIFNKDNVENGVKIYVPNYQRKFRWKPIQKSRFIESIFLGVPIPPIFGVVDNKTGSVELIDGMQRVSTICAFYNNEFKIEELLSIGLVLCISIVELDIILTLLSFERGRKQFGH